MATRDKKENQRDQANKFPLLMHTQIFEMDVSANVLVMQSCSFEPSIQVSY
jgi:hypothetical protein